MKHSRGAYYGQLTFIKKLVWLYFLLLIFEGGLRKWILPGFSIPLLIIRDPIAIWILLLAWKDRLLSANIYIISMVVIGIASMLFSMFEHANIAVALFGARTLIIHFPLLIVAGRVFNREDVLQIGKTTLWITIPMTLLVAIQFYSPQSAWVNRGVGGDLEGAGFSGALGFFRPPGTFSFTNGNTLFYSLTGCFLYYFWLKPENVNRLLLILSTVTFIIAIPFSISRALFFQTIVGFIFMIIFILLSKPKYIGQLLVVCLGLLLILNILNQLPFFQKSTEVFFTRFDSANEFEGGLEGVLLDRFLGGLISTFSSTATIPFFGYGIGLGTNVGSVLLTGEKAFLISEGEWGRQIGELGPLMGFLVIYLRLHMVIMMLIACCKKLVNQDPLPWMLLSFGLLLILQGQWGQPTSLGFSTLLGSLIIASLSSHKSDD